MEIFHDLPGLIKAVGYLGLFIIVFAESGLLIGMFLPGDSLLFTAGFLASQGFLDLLPLITILFAAAVIGDNVGYSIGHRYGHRVFKKQKSLFFSQDHIRKSEEFYKKHGGKTIILARFTPIVRTIAPVLAGVGKMEYRMFLTYNIIGGLLWAVGLTLAGYYLGKAIPDVDKYLLPIVAVIVAASVLPPAIHMLRDHEQRQKIKNLAKQARDKLRRK